MKMLGLPIAGFACPYGKPNSYNETILPGAFPPAYIRALNAHGLPMHISHDGPPIGHWVEFHDLPEGLYVRGYVTDPRAIRYVDALPDDQRKLSITYDVPRRDDIPREARLNMLRSMIERREVFDPFIAHSARLAEISLVKSPAFKDAYFQVTGAPEKK